RIVREIKNSHYFLDSWTQLNSVGSFIHIFFHQNYPTLRNHRVQQATIFHDQGCSTILSSGPSISLIVSLLYFTKGKKRSLRAVSGIEREYRVLPITKKCVSCLNLTEFAVVEDWIGKKRKRGIFVCKISNETVAGIDISFKEKDIKYLEFLFYSKFSEDWICYLMFAFRVKKYQLKWRVSSKQQGAGSTIPSNDIEHVSHLFSRNKRAISLQNCAQFHMWPIPQDLFVVGGKNPHESDFLRKISRENWIWLDNVWLVNKDRFFSKKDRFFGILPYSNGRKRDRIRPIPKYLSDIPQCPGYSRNRSNFIWVRILLRGPLGIRIVEERTRCFLLSLPGDRKIKKNRIVNIFKILRIYNIPSQFILFHSDLDVIRFPKDELDMEDQKIGSGSPAEFFEDPKPKRVVFASNNIMEANYNEKIRSTTFIEFEKESEEMIQMVQWSKNFQEHLTNISFSERKSRFQVVFDRLCINQYSIDWSEFREIPIHRSEIHIYELKVPKRSTLQSVSSNRSFKKLKPFLLDDHNTSQKSKFLINGGTISPFLFNKIPKWMIDSFHTRRIAGNLLITRIPILHRIPRSRQWLNPWKPFQRSSLISSFSKANRLRFLNNPHHSASIVTKDSLFMWKGPSQ
ncbi:hypothetical protein HID58_096033, partial [Brassica napus]